MAKNKFGTFAGVFTPSILTILGVIMYMRMGWVVGNAGLIGTILIVVVSHIISISTGLSVSSIATDKKVGAGGIYYILSRSMGIPIGGAIGITLYVGTAASIALYLIGFAESFNPYFGFSGGLDGLRITGTIALVSLTAIALISTSFALKTQFFILAAIILSLLSIFLGTKEFAPTTIAMFAGDGAVPLATVFAIYFPAVTGFTAGIAMSGDLGDPKKSIPVGTIAAIAVGFVVYIGLAFFIAYSINPEVLRSDNNILMKIALFGPAVAAGIWGATLSSALGGILGGPRILQAMSVDSITPKIFAKGKGKGNEPINALLLVFVIAEMGILIGELDVIARVVSMFFLSAYGFINLSFFLESWANPDFQPSFKVKRWFGVIGFVACFGVMFKLDMLAMFGAIAVILGIYFWLQRKQILLETGDVWQSVWENIVLKGLKRLELKDTASNNWNPNIILFSGETNDRPYLLEFSKAVAGRTGIVTNFNLMIHSGNKHLSKNDQNDHHKMLDDLGIFGRKVEVENIYTGIETIASTFGFTGIDPNTVMMGWPKNTSNPEEYNKMTQKLIHLDYNLLYLDYDERYAFGKYQTIDLWWRGTDNNNAEMMLNIVRLVTQSEKWSKAKIRILYVNYNNSENSIVKSKISNLAKKLRIDVKIIIINNGVDQKPFYQIIEHQSATTDLIILGIPSIEIEKQADFILKTNQLFENIGTTLLVKASNNFNEVVLDNADAKIETISESFSIQPLASSKFEAVNQRIHLLDSANTDALVDLIQPISSISSVYYQLGNKFENAFIDINAHLKSEKSISEINQQLEAFLMKMEQFSKDFQKDNLLALHELFNNALFQFLSTKNRMLSDVDKKIKLPNKKTIPWRKTLNYFYQLKGLPRTQRTFYTFGERNFNLLIHFAEHIEKTIKLFIEKENSEQFSDTHLTEMKISIQSLIKTLKKDALDLSKQFIASLKQNERMFSNELVDAFDHFETIHFKKLDKKEIGDYESNIAEFANDWYQNQILSHHQFEASLNLKTKAILVADYHLDIKSCLKNALSPQFEKLDYLLLSAKNVEAHLLGKSKSKFQIKGIDELIEMTIHLKLEDLIQEQKERISASFHGSSRTKELIHIDALNHISNTQNDLETIQLDLENIQNHIIQSAYVHPLDAEINVLEQVFNENSDEIYNTANLIKYLFESTESTEHKSKIENIEKAKVRLQTAKNRLQRAISTFETELDTYLGNTFSDLNIRSILNSSDAYVKISSKPILDTKLGVWINQKKTALLRQYQMVKNFVIVRKQEIDVIKFDEKHLLYENKIEQTYNFIRAISIDPNISNELSFYYKKLFTGSHLGKLVHREKSFATARRSIQRINEGVAGGIIILGTSLSGKTIFTTTLAKENKGKIFVINPPLKQNYQIKDIQNAILKALDKKGDLNTILGHLSKKTTFIFNDLEQWWLKNEDGHNAINYLAKLIESFGNRHYFLLNCNIYSFQAMRKYTTLESQLLSTIIMSPVNKSDLKKMLLNRHKTGGINLWYKHNLIGETNKIDPLFAHIHQCSQGNIGLALNCWISNIRLQDNDLILKRPSANFPKIKDAHWKIVLYLILIHYKIRKDALVKIFGKDSEHWIENTLMELKKSGLIYKQSYDSYLIEKNARPFVERWLADFGILIA